MSRDNREKIIATRMKEARRLSGLSQGQAAKMMDMHRPTISEIEAGNRRVSAAELSRFAEIYDVDASFLMGEGPDKMNPADPKLQIAARELSKLSPEALNSLMRVLAAFRAEGTSKPASEDDEQA
jgi:transcriptional regulator with XRE-family HTH domain